jgi:hypothetical protein
VPESVADALRDFDQTVEKDMSLMIESLNDSIAADPNNLIYNDAYNSGWYASASGLYWQKFIPLRPKADIVAKEMRSYYASVEGTRPRQP